MDLEERLADMERRLAALEHTSTEPTPAAPAPATAPVNDFWALDGLKVKLATDPGAPNGGVVFAGSIRLPSGERYEWQSPLVAAPLDADWSDAAESFAALGHPVRMRLLREILGGRSTVAELASLEDLGTTGQIYHHVRQLTAAGWLHTAARGSHEVPPGRVVALLVALAASRP